MPNCKGAWTPSEANTKDPFDKEEDVKAMFLSIVFALSLVGSNLNCYAQAKVVRGEGSMTVQGPPGSVPSDSDRNMVMSAAKLTAWRSYLALPGQNETVDQIRSNEKQFLDRLDDLLVDIVVVDEAFSKDTRRYSIRIKATVAESVVNSIIRTSSRASVKAQVAGDPATRSPGSAAIMVLGMSREAELIKTFLEKKTTVRQSSSSSEQAGNESSSKAGTARRRVSAESSSASTSNQTLDASGGNREQKRDKVTYKVGNVSILNSKLPRILLQSGIKSTPYAFLMRSCQLPNPDSFSKQYAASEQGELPSEVMAEIQDKLQSCGRAKFWAFASMDTGGYKTDPNTGLSLVSVTVSVQLMEVETGAQLASASKEVSGRSADQTDAMRIATGNAVQAVGDILSAQVAELGK